MLSGMLYLAVEDIGTAVLLALGCLLWVLGVGTFVICLITGIVWLASMKQRALARGVGPIDVHLQPNTVRPGESVTFTVRFCPSEAIHLTRATAELSGCEEARYEHERQVSQEGGSAVDTYTYKLLLHNEQKTLVQDRDYRPHETAVLEGSLQLPVSAPASFYGAYNTIAWTLHLNLSMANGFTWTKEVAITVQP